MSNLKRQFERAAAKYCKYIPVQNFEYAVNVSVKYNYLYVETPKVCCSTIKSVLQRLELNDPEFYRADFEDIHNRAFSPLLKPSQLGDLERFLDNNQPFRFCFSRNPYSRLLSAYLDKIETNRPQKRNILLQLGKDGEALEEKVSFEDFVVAVCEQPVFFMDAHWRVQYYQTFQERMRYDFFGKMERFADDFSNVLSVLGVDESRFLVSERRHAHGADDLVREFFTPKLAKLVSDKYAKDFAFFGYKIDLP